MHRVLDVSIGETAPVRSSLIVQSYRSCWTRGNGARTDGACWEGKCSRPFVNHDIPIKWLAGNGQDCASICAGYHQNDERSSEARSCVINWQVNFHKHSSQSKLYHPWDVLHASSNMKGYIFGIMYNHVPIGLSIQQDLYRVHPSSTFAFKPSALGPLSIG